MNLANYYMAGYPVLHVVSTDYDSAYKYVREEYKKIPDIDEFSSVVCWRLTSGMQVGDISSETLKTTDIHDVVEALMHVAVTPNTLAIFFNVRQFLQDPPMIQAVLDAFDACKSQGTHVVFIGPECQYPIELKNVITRFDYELPTKEKLRKQFSELAYGFVSNIYYENGGCWDDDLILVDGKEEFTEQQEQILDSAAQAALGLDSVAAENAFYLSVASTHTIDVNLIQRQKESEIKKSDVLEFVPVPESLDVVGGMSVFKDWLSKRKDAFSDEARKYGLPYPKGILLAGIAGTGKSLAAKAVAHYLQLPLIRLDFGAIFRSLVGESEAAIRNALKVAEAVAPCVTGDTMVQLSDGREIAAQELFDSVQISVPIMAFNPETHSFVESQIIGISKKSSIGVGCYEIITPVGTIKRTGNHKVFTKRGWVKVSELVKDGDFIAFKINTQKQSQSFTRGIEKQNDICWGVVKAVRKIKDQDVFDLHCAFPHTYVGDGAIDHNCLLWADEIDKGMAGAKNSGNLDSGVSARVVSTILTWRSETKAPVLLVATANDITSIPAMVYRKGRFDEVWFVDLPNTNERVEIFRIHIAKRGRNPGNYDLHTLAIQADGWVGSEIEAAIEEAMFAGFQAKREFTTEDILQAIAVTIPQSKRDREEINDLRNWAADRARNVSLPEQVKTNKVRQLKKGN